MTRQPRTPLLWALAPVAAVGVPVGLAALSGAPDVVRVLCFLPFLALIPALPLLYLWHLLFRVGSRPPPYMTGLQARIGGEITIERRFMLQPVLRTHLDGADVTIRSMVVRTGHRRTGPAVLITSSERSALSLVGVNPAPRWWSAWGVPAVFGVGTGGTRSLPLRGRLERFEWATDRPDVATALLDDEETLQAWIRLLTQPDCGAVVVSMGGAGAICAALDGGLDTDGVEALLNGLHRVTREANAKAAASPA